MTVVMHPVEVELKYDVNNARCTCDDSKLRRRFQSVSKVWRMCLKMDCNSLTPTSSCIFKVGVLDNFGDIFRKNDDTCCVEQLAFMQ